MAMRAGAVLAAMAMMLGHVAADDHWSSDEMPLRCGPGTRESDGWCVGDDADAHLEHPFVR